MWCGTLRRPRGANVALTNPSPASPAAWCLPLRFPSPKRGWLKTRSRRTQSRRCVGEERSSKSWERTREGRLGRNRGVTRNNPPPVDRRPADRPPQRDAHGAVVDLMIGNESGEIMRSFVIWTMDDGPFADVSHLNPLLVERETDRAPGQPSSCQPISRRRRTGYRRAKSRRWRRRKGRWLQEERAVRRSTNG